MGSEEKGSGWKRREEKRRGRKRREEKGREGKRREEKGREGNVILVNLNSRLLSDQIMAL